MQTANYLRNRAPTRGLGQNVTPYEAYNGEKPSVKHLRTWGCKCWVHIPDSQRTKLDPKSWEGTMVGYSETQKAWRIWNPARRQVFVSRDVIFAEGEVGNPPEVDRELPGAYDNWEPETRAEEVAQGMQPEVVGEVTVFIPRITPPAQNLKLAPALEQLPEEEASVQDLGSDNDQEQMEEVLPVPAPHSPPPETEEPEEETEKAPALESETAPEPAVVPRRSSRERKEPERLAYSKMGQQRSSTSAYAMIAEARQSLTYTQVLISDEKNLWKEAIDREMGSLSENNTSTLVEAPPKTNIVGSKWLFKKKDKRDGGCIYKARLVAKGYSQVEGVDYDETFAPVIKF